MKYLVTGLIMILAGIGFGVWHLFETVPDTAPLVQEPRPIAVKSMLAPYLVTLGAIITFAGIISLHYNRPKKKRNYYRR